MSRRQVGRLGPSLSLALQLGSLVGVRMIVWALPETEDAKMAKTHPRLF